MLDMDSAKVQTRLVNTMVQLGKYQSGGGVFSKEYVKKSAKTMPPAEWWDLFGGHIPLLKSVAMTVLSQPVCASAAERNWSVYGAIKTPARGRLGHAVADKLVYCHEAIHMQTKLQDANYVQSVERWQGSDSEFDDSDDNDSGEEDLSGLMV
jgi:hypothetical protein